MKQACKRCGYSYHDDDLSCACDDPPQPARGKPVREEVRVFRKFLRCPSRECWGTMVAVKEWGGSVGPNQHECDVCGLVTQEKRRYPTISYESLPEPDSVR